MLRLGHRLRRTDQLTRGEPVRTHLRYQPRHAQRRTVGTLIAGAVVTAAATPALLLAGAPAAQAALCPSPPVKCFRVDLTPTSFVAGSTVAFTEKLTNESGGQSLGSSNLTAPTGYTVTSVGTPSRGTAAQAGNQIQLRNLNLPTGQAVTVSFTAATPSTVGSSTWTATAKQSNDYNGTGNDFVLDPTSSLTTTGSSGSAGGGGGTPGCSASDVSCGTNFIRYNHASTVSTGNTVNATVWLVGRMDFPATSVSGGQNYSMHAPSQPGSFCPVNGVPAQCTFEMDIDPVPTPYDANHPATLTLLCHSSHCSTGAYVLVKQDENGTVTPIPACPLNLTGEPCFTESTDADGIAVITVSNITAGDPRVAGIDIP
jgi:hypothetical protein